MFVLTSISKAIHTFAGSALVTRICLATPRCAIHHWCSTACVSTTRACTAASPATRSAPPTLKYRSSSYVSRRSCECCSEILHAERILITPCLRVCQCKMQFLLLIKMIVSSGEYCLTLLSTEAPLVNLESQIKEVAVGARDVTLQCLAEGSPPPRFTWSKKGGSLPR